MSDSDIRRICFLADAHIGQVSDDRDGAEWLQMAVEDVAEHVPVDYVINLGDMSAKYQPEQFAAYAEIRENAGFGPWFEVVGNHDFRGTRTGDYQKYIGCPPYWRLDDGNLTFLSLGAERGNAAGLFLPPVEAWLRDELGDVDGQNVVMAAHSFPHDTVEHSLKPARYLHPAEAVWRFIREVRIDLWLGGHAHMTPRHDSWSAVREGVTFINCASVSHAYNTEASHSFVLEVTPGASKLVARCRLHDEQPFDNRFEVTVPLSHPAEPAGGPPVLTPADLSIPEHYREIDEEVVESFSS